MGPLTGFRIIELAGFGPGPMGAMMLGDMGADVIRVERANGTEPPRFEDARYDVHGRSRRSVVFDLKSDDGRDCFFRLVETADALIDPYRPGVAERLGIGPDACLEKNARLNYLRITGWGQTGPLAGAAGHDLNYIALIGLLDAIGPAGQKPVIPLNLVGDYGGGGMLVALGITAALLETSRSGIGQIIDAAMLDGANLLFGSAIAMHNAGLWREKGSNQVDGGAPYYHVYETADGKFITIGSIEPKFFRLLQEKIGFDARFLSSQFDRSAWPEAREALADIFRQRTRQEWIDLLEGSDVCFAPVLDMSEARSHPQMVARSGYVDVSGVPHPAPAPRFSRTQGRAKSAPRPGEHTQEILLSLGLSAETIDRLMASGVVRAN
ncbi:CaiB/BaiF CoA transferase family protein [Propylenella binzhouense]|uniref:CoA transferase n=1 Tax=Propylenella binzhouense TaxID=2555902 RepID=A0A964T1A7_9HYPH|nr:CaiB/BaiF CoA-transferase family protein [Propylenella binzhouense]MYZ46404.1 CoA transferase [Propylenella binzhouense]